MPNGLIGQITKTYLSKATQPSPVPPAHLASPKFGGGMVAHLGTLAYLLLLLFVF